MKEVNIYKFKVTKTTEEEFSGLGISAQSKHWPREENVFEVEITADEMVEMMQHLWSISERRKANPTSKQ